MDLNFSILLTRALLDWPKEIDLAALTRSSPDTTRYSIEGLYGMAEKVDERYYDTPEEIILRNMHGAIYEVLHAAGAYVTHVRISDLRSEAIRTSFERHLRECMSRPALEYTAEDIELGGKYFSVNPPL